MSSKGNTPWRKSIRSGGNGGQCVEVRRHDDAIEVRDSKDPTGPVLSFSAEAWHDFLTLIRQGESER
jgi:hypothetical protein